jgi:hypothetical protein
MTPTDFPAWLKDMGEREMTDEARDEIKNAVQRAMYYWPNSHLGAISRREDMRSAFRMIRSWAKHYSDIWQGIGALERETDRYVNM